jgi:hypothetical protein
MFEARREMTVEAKVDGGAYRLTTRGLARHDRPELEITGLPEAAIDAGADLLNRVADYTVNRAQLRDGERLALELAIEGVEQTPLLVVIRARGRGVVLRVVDPVSDEPAVPLTAVATMLVHRARAHVANEEPQDAIAQLRASIGILPGAATAHLPPFEGTDAIYNWHNHYAYLELSKLIEDARGARHLYGQALARNRALMIDELGGDPRQVAAASHEDALDQLDSIAELNLESAITTPEAGVPVHMVVSPIWQPLEDGRSGRCASVIPSGLVGCYYQGRAREALEGTMLTTLVADCFDRHRDELVELAWRTRAVRKLYLGSDAEIVDVVESHPADCLLSALLTEAARCVHGGVTEAELRVHFGLSDDAKATRTLSEKLAELEEWEGDQYLRAMGFDIDRMRALERGSPRH